MRASNSKHWHRCSIGLLAIIFSFTVNRPTLALHPYVEFPELVHTADMIFSGTVTKLETRWGPGQRMIFTDVTFDHVETIHRKADVRAQDHQPVVLSFAGGEVDGINVSVSGVPRFQIGDEYLLFALHDGQTYANPLVGGMQGRFRMMTDPQTNVRYPLGEGDVGIQSLNVNRLQLTTPIDRIENGAITIVQQRDGGSIIAAPTMVLDGAVAGVPMAATAINPSRIVPESILTFEQFINEIQNTAALPAPAKQVLRGLRSSPPTEKSEFPLTVSPRLQEIEQQIQDRTELKPSRPEFQLQQNEGELNLEKSRTRTDESGRLKQIAPKIIEGIVNPDVGGGVAGTSLCWCGNHDLNLVMEQIPAAWWSYSHNEDSMWQWNQFMDIYRFVPTDGGVGNNNDNEFAGWPSNATLNNIWGFNWGGALALTITYTFCQCCEIVQSDLMFNPANTWYSSFNSTFNNANRILYRPVVMHELGHTWGMQRDACTEDYSYNRLSVMHAYYFDVVEDGWGIHSGDAWAIRDAYDSQKSVLSRVDMGVESYFASSGLGNASTNTSTYFVGDPITVQNITVENMSSSSTKNVRIRLWLSTNKTISTGDHQMGGFWYWNSFGSQSWWRGNLSTSIPDIPAGTYYVGAIVTRNGSSYSFDDLNFNNQTFLPNTITVKRRPDNDSCGNAILVGADSVTNGTTIDATNDNAPFCNTSNTRPGVWYKVIGTGHRLRASTCNGGTNFDTKISVYCNKCSNKSCVAGNDDGAFTSCQLNGVNRKSSVTWCTQRGAEYLILVHGHNNTGGNFRLAVGDDGKPCSGAVSCGGDPIGACCAPQICNNGGTCNSGFPYCEASFSCFCFKASEGGGACTPHRLCGAITECPNGTSDCGPDEVCVVDTCCDSPVCLPSNCSPGILESQEDSTQYIDVDIEVTGRESIYEIISNDLSLSPLVADEMTTTGLPVGFIPGSVAGGAVEGCFETDVSSCGQSGGLYQGDGVSCGQIDCNPPGACCHPDGTCSNVIPTECTGVGGSPKGPGTSCTNFTCPPPVGACCAAETCSSTFVCDSGTVPTCGNTFGCFCVETANGITECVADQACGTSCPNGDVDCPAGNVCVVNTCCDGPVCGVPGCPVGSGTIATVIPDDSMMGKRPLSDAGSVAGVSPHCAVLNEETCGTWQSDYQGDLTTCDDVVCFEPSERCCNRDGGCVDAPPSVCSADGGSPGGPGSECGDVICIPVVACCLFGLGGCADMDLGRCLESRGRPLPEAITCQGDANGDGTDDACQFDDACEDCGPGDHWIDRCPAGLDTISTGALIGIDTNLDGVQDASFRLNGPVRIIRSDSAGHTIATEMVSMDLVGGGLTMIAGAGRGQGGILFETFGKIVEQPANAAIGDSFFDVFVEIQLPGGVFLYNVDPLTVKTSIDCLPPDTTYIHPQGLIGLYTSPFRDKGRLIANLVTADHRTYPCGDKEAGDCLTPNPTPYCDNADCCARICALEPFCCEVEWGENCAGLAREVCDPVQACCFPDDSCRDIGLNKCEFNGGIPQGPDSTCANTECRPLFACCLSDGRCAEMPKEVCLEREGTPLPAGAKCEGDRNDNGTDDACEADEPCGDCGPGFHWIDECVAGDDVMPSGALIGIDFEGDCVADTTIVLRGNMRVRRSNPSDISSQFPGLGVDDGHRDVIDTEMVQLQLSGGGVSLTAGGGLGNGGLLRRSLGAIVELPRNTAEADSFFDVFFELDLGNGLFAYNHEPLVVRSNINCIPPDTTYIHPIDCIKLFDSPILNEGNVVAYLVSADHSTFPSCGDAVSGSCFEPNNTPYCDDGDCCKRVCEVESSCCDQSWHAVCADLANELCLQPEACCLPDGQCGVLLPIECRELRGETQGPGTFCDPGTCPAPQACCLADGGCKLMMPEHCRLEQGTVLGPDSKCLGDNNGNRRDDACEPNNACDECGPGTHWIDQCRSGSDSMNTSALIGLDRDFDCEPDISLRMTGPVTVWRNNPSDDSSFFPGSSLPDGHLDVIDTMMMSMSLTGGGMTLTAGQGLGQGGVLPPTLGMIIEQPGDPAQGDSFFDIFFEVEVGPGFFVYNHTPLKVTAKINCLPPDTTYIHPFECIPLYNSPIPGTGEVVMQLVSADHSTFPKKCGDQGTGGCTDPENSSPYCDDVECCKKVCSELPHCCEQTWDPGCADFARQVCVRPQACCQDDGTCTDMPEEDCLVRGGTPQGPDTLCSQTVCEQTQACCLPEGRCAEITAERCRRVGGITHGPGTVCEGDLNNNNIDDACEEDDACEDCGPGDHWVDTCPSGSDIMPTAALVGIDRDGDCQADLTFRLTGPVHVWRSNPNNHTIATEILSMQLTQSGVTLTAGAGLGMGGVLRPSVGAIIEQPANPALADSFFDVFFEVDLGGGLLLYNADPLRVESIIDCLPPDTDYIHPRDCIPLYNSPDPATGEIIANLVRADHSTYPPDDCFAKRNLADPELSYCPTITKTVQIALNVPLTTQTVGLEDSPPAGWIVSNISHGGLFDEVNGKVKWGPYFAPFPTVVSYDVTPVGNNERGCFQGTISINGEQQEPVCGDDCIALECCPAMDADTQQAICDQCDVDNNCGAFDDHRVEICEMTGYACQWKNGCNDNLSGMTRAAFVWKNGECYCYDESTGTWNPSVCGTSDVTGCCSAVTVSAEMSSPIALATAKVPLLNTGRSSTSTSRRVTGRTIMTIPIAVSVPADTTVVALDYAIPPGWVVVNISDEGQWDDTNRKVKWGPFFENHSRTVSLTIRSSAKKLRLDELKGTLSVDGLNSPIVRE